MKRVAAPFLRKGTSEIIEDSRADLGKAVASQSALRDLISETQKKIRDSKALLRRIDAVLNRVNRSG